MRTSMLLFVLMICLSGLSAQVSQADNSNPIEVSQKFLDLYFKGQWFQACQLYGCQDCEVQISFMFKKQAEMDDADDDSTCKFTVDSCRVDPNLTTGKCYYTKICASSKAKRHYLMLKKVNDKWLVEYLYKRDKFF